MHHPLRALLCSVFLVACGRPDPWEPCATSLLPPGMQSRVAPCTGDCARCGDQLARSWRGRSDPSQAAALRLHYLRAPAPARDRFLTATHADGVTAWEHCTVGLAPGATCAAFTPLCQTVLAEGLRAAETSLEWRTQMNVAVSRACDASRDAIVAQMRRCDPVDPARTCDAPSCLACAAGHLAALTVLAPRAENPESIERLEGLVRDTPAPVARRIVESLGSPDAPADIEPVVVQRGLRHYCFSLVSSGSLPPFACRATFVRFLTHTEYPDAARAWEALRVASPEARSQLLDALLTQLCREPTLPPEVLTRLRPYATGDGLPVFARVMSRATTTDAAYAALRGWMQSVGVAPAQVPPVVRTSAPVNEAPLPPPSPTDSTPRGGGGGVAA